MNGSVTPLRHHDADDDFLHAQSGAQAAGQIGDTNAIADAATDATGEDPRNTQWQPHWSNRQSEELGTDDADAEVAAAAEPPPKKKGVMIYVIGLFAVIVVVITAIVGVIILNKPRAAPAESGMMKAVAPESGTMPATVGGSSSPQPFAPIDAAPQGTTSAPIAAGSIEPIGAVAPLAQPPTQPTTQPAPALQAGAVTPVAAIPVAPAQNLAGKVDEQAIELATLKNKVAVLEAQIKDLFEKLKMTTSVPAPAKPAAPAPAKAAAPTPAPAQKPAPTPAPAPTPIKVAPLAPANAPAWELKGIAGNRGLIGSATQPLLTVMVGDNVPGLGVVKKVDADKGEIQFANATLR
jgi:hypothetical protein